MSFAIAPFSRARDIVFVSFHFIPVCLALQIHTKIHIVDLFFSTASCCYSSVMLWMYCSKTKYTKLSRKDAIDQLMRETNFQLSILTSRRALLRSVQTVDLKVWLKTLWSGSMIAFRDFSNQSMMLSNLQNHTTI